MPGSAPRALQHGLEIALRSAQMVGATGFAAYVLAREWLRTPEFGGRGREHLLRAFGRALVGFATQLGATFIKLGQIASTRGDLLAEPLRRELATLQDRVPPFPFREVRHTIESELGQPLEAIYERFQPSPVAAASVAQVHRAVLRGAEQWVAVKVRRPDILEKVRLDRSILLFLGRTLERLVPSLRLLSLEGALRSFCDAVEQQIHLSNEAEHNRRFTQNFADETEVRFPRLFPAACSDAVLTMEFIEGVHESELEAAGILVHRVVAAGMRAVCRMIFLHGFVHADLHPGNLRFMPPGCIVLLDLGLVGTLDDVDRLTTARLLFAFAVGDGGAAVLRPRTEPGDGRLFCLRARDHRPRGERAKARPWKSSGDTRDRANLRHFAASPHPGPQPYDDGESRSHDRGGPRPAAGARAIAHRRGPALSRRGARGVPSAERGLRERLWPLPVQCIRARLPVHSGRPSRLRGSSAVVGKGGLEPTCPACDGAACADTAARARHADSLNG